MKQLVVIASLAATLGLSACGGGESSADIIRDRAIGEGLDPDIAQCMVDYLDDNLSDADMKIAAEVTDANLLSAEALEVVTDSLVECNVPPQL